MYISGSARFQLPTTGVSGSAEVQAGPHQAESLVQAVDFPDFVDGLIKGTFKANVDASVRQMEAYADLMQGVSKPADDFAHRTVADALAARHPRDDA